LPVAWCNDTLFTGSKRPRLHGCEHEYEIKRRGSQR
jgi:hypothetical protein